MLFRSPVVVDFGHLTLHISLVIAPHIQPQHSLSIHSSFSLFHCRRHSCLPTRLYSPFTFVCLSLHFSHPGGKEIELLCANYRMTPRLQQQTALWLSSNKGPRRQPGAHSRCSPACTVSRQILILGLLLVTLSLHNTGVGGCGVTIHNEIAFRASQILLSAAGHDERSQLPFAQPYPHSQSVLHANIKGAAHSNDHWHERARPNQSKALHNYATLLAQKDALFAGSFFPDWGYNCIGKLWNQAAEEVRRIVHLNEEHCN